MKTTVVIPNYNGIKYLENCMNKLELARKISDFEILLVDNGSVDGSLELCRDMKKRDRQKQFILRKIPDSAELSMQESMPAIRPMCFF